MPWHNRTKQDKKTKLPQRRLLSHFTFRKQKVHNRIHQVPRCAIALFSESHTKSRIKSYVFFPMLYWETFQFSCSLISPAGRLISQVFFKTTLWLNFGCEVLNWQPQSQYTPLPPLSPGTLRPPSSPTAWHAMSVRCDRRAYPPSYSWAFFLGCFFRCWLSVAQTPDKCLRLEFQV